MNKILLGIIVGAICGAVDGLTAWFEPAVRSELLTIVFLSSIKGVIAGIAAGWFARKVQSVPKGIAFGFVVGLTLAYLVAMNPDPKTGEHYYWQIMLPGALFGAVIGWATQRYGRPAANRNAATAAATIAMLLLATTVSAHDHGSKTNPAFEKLKSLAGTWNGRSMSPDGDRTKVTYEVTGGGSVVMERMFVGEPHEMINMYTLQGDDVIATHYCSAGNQPVLKLNAAKSNDKRLVFDFVSVTGKKTASYINGVTMTFDGGKVQETWTSSNDGHTVNLYLAEKQ